MKWYQCADGRTAQVFDLLHLFLYPQSDIQVESVLGYCRYPRVYDLPTVWNALPEENSLFLPKELVDTFTALFVVSIPVILCLILARYAWDYIDPYFNSISPSHKKWYVVANLSKAFFLGCIVLSTNYTSELVRVFSDDFGSSLLTKRSMALYVVTDIVALLLVPKLPRSTVIHHVVTFLLGSVTWGTNLQIKGYKGVLSVAKMGFIYGMICCISFLVNAYLALRVVYPKSKAVKVLCFVSLISYVVCCGVNWTYQIYWFVNLISTGEFSLYAVVYILLMLTVVNDDIVLIKWLLMQNSPMAATQESSKKE